MSSYLKTNNYAGIFKKSLQKTIDDIFEDIEEINLKRFS